MDRLLQWSCPHCEEGRPLVTGLGLNGLKIDYHLVEWDVMRYDRKTSKISVMKEMEMYMPCQNRLQHIGTFA